MKDKSLIKHSQTGFLWYPNSILASSSKPSVSFGLISATPGSTREHFTSMWQSATSSRLQSPERLTPALTPALSRRPFSSTDLLIHPLISRSAAQPALVNNRQELPTHGDLRMSTFSSYGKLYCSDFAKSFVWSLNSHWMLWSCLMAQYQEFCDVCFLSGWRNLDRMINSIQGRENLNLA